MQLELQFRLHEDLDSASLDVNFVSSLVIISHVHELTLSLRQTRIRSQDFMANSDINTRDDSGKSMLFRAAEAGDVVAVARLLDLKADTELCDIKRSRVRFCFLIVFIFVV